MKRLGLTMSSAMIALSVGSASAATSIAGQVQAGGAPVAASTVTLWAASGDAPKQLAQAKTADDGSFTLALDAAAAPRPEPLSHRQGWRCGRQQRRWR